jgi:translation initiation factor 4G
MGALFRTAKEDLLYNCEHNEDACIEVGHYVEAVIKILSKKVGQGQAGEVWNDAQLQWNMFLPKEDIEKFVKEHELEFTLSSEKGTEEFEDILKRLLKESKPNDNNGIIDALNKYLGITTESSNVEPDNQFIRTLTTAVAESTIRIEADHPSNRSLDQDAMQQRAVILKRYLDAKVERETQALFALQALVHRLEHPNKLLHQIFECLYQADVITYEGFEQWEQSKDPAEQEGKGVAIKSTTQFFT